MDELKLPQVQLFSLFHLKSVAANVYEFVCVCCKQLLNVFYNILNFHFNLQVLSACYLVSLSQLKPTKTLENAFFKTVIEIQTR